jgi:mxaJ protein
VRGYTVYGDYRSESPPAEIVRAVARNEIDVGIVWGPLAAFYARRQAVPLRLSAVSPQVDVPFLPFVFDISMAVRREDRALHEELDGIIERRQAEIDRILDDYGVPRLSLGGDASGGR